MKILFVCTANVCRSALAEVVLRKKLFERRLDSVEIMSAGVRNYEGMPRDEIMVVLARKAGYDMGGNARYISDDMLDADLIICMEHFHVVEMQKRFPYARWNRIRRFNEICFGEETNMPDPSGNTDYIYQYTLERIEAGCDSLIIKLPKRI